MLLCITSRKIDGYTSNVNSSGVRVYVYVCARFVRLISFEHNSTNYIVNSVACAVLCQCIERCLEWFTLHQTDFLRCVSLYCAFHFRLIVWSVRFYRFRGMSSIVFRIRTFRE